MKTPPDHPTRAALLEAGLHLADRQPLAQMSVDAVVGKAGVAKGTFYLHFKSRADFLVALHRRFHDALHSAIDRAARSLPTAAVRVQAGTEAYLDGCLARRGVKAFLLEARAEAAITQEIARRNRSFYEAFAGELKELGWPAGPAPMRLYVAMVAEAALAELEAGKRDPAIRRALWHFLGAAAPARKRATAAS